MADAEPKNFLSRWARRKLASSLGRPPGVESASVEPPAKNPGAEAEDELRRLALRALFREPQFAIRDGLDDYDGDYTFFEGRGELLTQDMLRALERGERQRADAASKETKGDSAPDSEIA